MNGCQTVYCSVQGTFSLSLFETIDQALIRVGPLLVVSCGEIVSPIDTHSNHRSKLNPYNSYTK